MSSDSAIDELKLCQNGEASVEDEKLHRPDPDTIKMFIGQIPKSWNEEKLKEYFEEFGPIYQLNILKDKETAVSRGCCFVTFYHRCDAIAAQSVLHNIRIFPGLRTPIQVRPADAENKNERKLFVGMLAKTMEEDDIRELFKEFGQIEECIVLREQDGKSKGCAFLTFVTRSCAQQAVRKLHHSRILEGCTKPLVVKFADCGKDKNEKKLHQERKKLHQVKVNEEPQNQNGGTSIQTTQTSLETLTSLVSLLQQPNIIPLLETARALQQLQTIQSSMATTNVQNNDTIAHPTQLPLLTPIKHQSSKLQTNLPAVQSGFLNISPFLFQQPAFLGTQPSLAAVSFAPTLTNNTALSLNLPNPAPHNQFHQLSTLSSPVMPTLFSPSSSRQANPTSGGNEKYQRGPDGCNLFIYHLPQDFVDSDLYSLFSHFGTILSAKVFIDKQTNLSKCFGFVSYADISAAENAISGMNGFTIGNKRLKVQLKRSDTKPYEKPSS